MCLVLCVQRSLHLFYDFKLVLGNFDPGCYYGLSAIFISSFLKGEIGCFKYIICIYDDDNILLLLSSSSLLSSSLLLFSQLGESYSQLEKGVKNYDVRVDNKYFSLLKQHSIISHLSYRCYENPSIKIHLLSVRLVSVKTVWL